MQSSAVSTSGCGGAAAAADVLFRRCYVGGLLVEEEKDVKFPICFRQYITIGVFMYIVDRL